MPLILGTNSIKDTGYNVANSLRFNDGSSDTLSRTPSSTGNRKTWTFSCWYKRGNIVANSLISSSLDGNNFGGIDIDNNSRKFSFFTFQGGSTTINLVTTRIFRDVSAWYHIMIAVDTTQGTASNRVKLYINGVQETAFDTEVYPSEDLDTIFNVASYVHRIGVNNDNNGRYLDGYLSEVVLVDGTAQANTDLGEFDSDSGIWKPIDVSGLTFGTNGFYLEFKQSGTSANASGLGADTSGNTHHLTVGNLTAVDQSTDTCTNNFATLNPLDNFYAASTFSEGNLKVVTNASNETYNTTTIGASSGKWYCEMKHVSSEPDDDTGTNRTFFGIADVPTGQSDSQGTGNVYIYRSDGNRYVGTTETSGYGDAWDSTGEIIGIAMDLDNNKLYFSVNGTFQNSGNPASGATGTGAIAIASNKTYFFVVGDSTPHAITNEMNFGSPPFAISSGNTDAEGFGNFEFAVPSGYFALCSKNLAEYG